MNINKVIKMEIQNFKKHSDSLTLAIAEEFQLDIEARINEYLIPIEEKMNEIHLKPEVSEYDLDEVYNMIQEFHGVLSNFKNFCDSSVKKVGIKSKSEHDNNINRFIEGLFERGIFDKNRVVLEIKKVSHYQLMRVIEGLNMAITSSFDSAYDRLLMNAEFFNNLLDGFEEEVDDVCVEINEKRSPKRKITDVKDMIKLVQDSGYIEVRQKGSHKMFKNENGSVVSVPYHSKGFNKGLAYAIQKQVGM